jgi:hypothetical protein
MQKVLLYKDLDGWYAHHSWLCFTEKNLCLDSM